MAALGWLLNLGFAASEDVVVGTVSLTARERATTFTLQGVGTNLDGAVFPLEFPFFLDDSNVVLSARDRPTTFTVGDTP